MRFPGKTLFSTPKPAVVEPLPPIPAPAEAPVPDDLAIENAKKRKAASVSQRSGRLSTINTQAPRAADTVLG